MLDNSRLFNSKGCVEVVQYGWLCRVSPTQLLNHLIDGEVSKIELMISKMVIMVKKMKTDIYYQ